MDNQVVVRSRMNIIVGHFAGTEDISATHVYPMNCSSNINSVIRRCDNRMFFARQGSISQACFMRQVSIKENFGQNNSSHSSVPPNSSGPMCEHSSFNISRVPMFAKPAQMIPEQKIIEQQSPVKQECKLSMTEPPKFSRPNRGLGEQKQIFSKKTRHDDIEWSPRMDVAEFGCNYVMTVELPGVSINNIRIEVDERNLTVTGKRSIDWWRVASGSEDSITAYHKREIVQGPYRVVWSLPSNVNKDSVSAEFLNGFLQITLPKI